jgi:hypothetical protein
MPRYLVTTRRALRGHVASALDAVRDAPEIQVVDARDPDMVRVEASEAAASKLKERLASTHHVDPEVRHQLH